MSDTQIAIKTAPEILEDPGSSSNATTVAEEEISSEVYTDSKISYSSLRNLSKTSLAKRLSSKISLATKKYHVSTCRICLSHLVNPGVLGCGHKFCEECLYKYWKNGDKADTIVCPLCRCCTQNITFSEKNKPTSPREFRQSFGALETASKSNIPWCLCLKTSIFIPALYCFTKCLKWFFVDFLFKNPV